MPLFQRGVGDAEADEEWNGFFKVKADGVVGEVFGLHRKLVEAEPGIDGVEGGDKEKPECW